ncbi:phage tail protein [Desulfitobacterium hafniense]|uniref:Phage tail protein n=2 Tax=Desulfitobacterium hafniense TaxID=49338 RepID=A0A0W1JNV5_DESHA|nr:phage tail protein [Desulfitobacterium hafniense]KTE92958.1 phage tail protein [Desulfitobacterium hafniense]
MDFVLTGSIVLFPYNYAPKTCLLCDGKTYSMDQYIVLFSLIGDFYGGNAEEGIFAVPNLMNASPFPGMNYYIVYDGIYPSRS